MKLTEFTESEGSLLKLHHHGFIRFCWLVQGAKLGKSHVTASGRGSDNWRKHLWMRQGRKCRLLEKVSMNKLKFRHQTLGFNPWPIKTGVYHHVTISNHQKMRLTWYEHPEVETYIQSNVKSLGTLRYPKWIEPTLNQVFILGYIGQMGSL